MAYASATALTTKEIDRDGLDLTTLAVTPTATHGNKFWNNGKTFLMVANASGDAINVTVNTPGEVAGLAISDLTVEIANGKTYAIGPFTSDFNQSDGYVWATFDAVTDVTIDAVTM